MTSTEADQRITELVDEVIRLAGSFLAEGDSLTAPFGLTAARWLVLGALQDRSVSVAGIARRRGLSRQSVRETAARLERDGLVARVPDPSDARAPRLELTQRGRTALEAIEPARAAWAERVATAITPQQLGASLEALRSIRSALAS